MLARCLIGFVLAFKVIFSVVRDVFICVLILLLPEKALLLCNAGVSAVLLRHIKCFVCPVYELQYILSKIICSQAN